jgi:hypothetical protein
MVLHELLRFCGCQGRGRPVRVIAIVLCLWPAWGQSEQSLCAQTGCSVSASVSFKIIIPPPPVVTRIPSAVATRLHEQGLTRRMPSVIFEFDGFIYIPTATKQIVTYTIAKP